MPIYEYECDDCGELLEVLVLSEDEPNTCSKCSGKLNRLISKSSFHLKGTGWYKTDYASTSSTDEAVSGSEVPDGVPSITPGEGITTATPIIKDRNTGETLQGPDIPDGDST